MKRKKYVPDAKLHLQISLIKSGLRIFAGLCLVLVIVPSYNKIELLLCTGVALIMAEVLGVMEELV